MCNKVVTPTTRRANLFSVLLVAITIGFGEADAANMDSIADVRCVIVAMKMGKAPGSAQQTSAIMIALYYLGRLDGRALQANIEDLIAKEVVKMTAAELRSEAVRCGTALAKKGEEISNIGNRLVEHD